MRKIIFGITALMLLFQLALEAQGVRRSVIASIGDSGTAGGLRLSCTVAQPPNAGTIKSGEYYLRQGFQQPVNSKFIDPNCVNAPAAEFTVDNFLDVCGEKFSFTFADIPGNNTTFSWNFGQDALPATSTLKDPLGIVYTTTGTKIVTLEVKTGTCVSTATYSITVTKASFGVFADASSLLCYEEKAGSIVLTALNGNLPYTYKWANGLNTSTIEGLNPGTYQFTVTDAIGCSFSSEAVIESPDSLAVSPAVTVETCNGAKDGAINLNVTGGTAPYDFAWSNGAVSEDLAGLTGGDYSLTLTDAKGCEKEFVIKVLTVCEGFEFDNLITPNGDGANDEWNVPGVTQFPENELQVFNRWGEVVYRQKNYDNTWQGTNEEGKPLPAGAYYYVLKLNDPRNTVYTGSISILR
jgi:gliding motility-associated-like protein